MCVRAAVAGAKVEKAFEEVYPQYSEVEEVPISPEAAKLMEALAQQQLRELEAQRNG